MTFPGEIKETSDRSARDMFARLLYDIARSNTK